MRHISKLVAVNTTVSYYLCIREAGKYGHIFTHKLPSLKCQKWINSTIPSTIVYFYGFLTIGVKQDSQSLFDLLIEAFTKDNEHQPDFLVYMKKNLWGYARRASIFYIDGQGGGGLAKFLLYSIALFSKIIYKGERGV